MPHLQRAVRLHFELESARCGATTILASLEYFLSAVFVVDHFSRILALNGKAEQMIATRDGLAVERSVLTARLTSEVGMLRRQISLATQDPIHDSDENGCFLISRQSGAEPYRVFVCPFPRAGAFPFSQRAALVFCVDPSAQPVSELKALKKAFGLTNAEFLLAGQLAEGINLEEAAGRLGITRNTAKTQLQSVYSKTGARRQAELIKLLYTMPRQRF
jgi:DNA-binding CsgD family transcriptional regulator